THMVVIFADRTTQRSPPVDHAMKLINYPTLSKPESRYLITVETTTGGLLLFRVNTPCLMPPATPGTSS
ncbi:hypothetical protein ACWC5I_40670, partial [Kitasatospora sp. NPDC001574]